MKLITRVTALALSLALLLTGCAGGKELTAKEVQQLLTNDYEVESIFALAGLPVDSLHPVRDAAETPYFPVDTEKYKTTADLKKLLDATYTPVAAAAILATTDANGSLLYTDIDGKLFRSAAPVVVGSATTLNTKAAKITPADKDADGNKTATLTIPELSGDTEVGKVTLTAVATKSGWRLAASRAMADAGQQEQQPAGAKEGSFADTAQQFLDAMVAGDAAKLKELATFADVMGMWDWSQVSFDFLASAGVTEAKVASTVREDERDAEYTVSITTDGSADVFPNGTSTYRMTVGVRQDVETMQDIGYTVVSLRSESTPPYVFGAANEPIPALDQVSRLINLNGMIQFDSPDKLDNNIQTEYLLYELSIAKPEQSEVGYTLEDIQAMAVRLLGMSSFTPAEQFYSNETTNYLLWGRGGVFTNCQLSIIEEANGLVKVEAAVFADPLQLNHTSSIIYTLKNNWNGTYELVSGVLSQE